MRTPNNCRQRMSVERGTAVLLSSLDKWFAKQKMVFLSAAAYGCFGKARSFLP